MSSLLFNPAGKRKYLTKEERQAFIAAAKRQTREVRTLWLTQAVEYSKPYNSPQTA